MKAVSTYVNGAVHDAKIVLPSLYEAYNRLMHQYQESTHPKLRMLDNLVIVCLLTFVLQIVYMLAVGTKEPLNALMAGCFCSLGQFALCGKCFLFVIQLKCLIPFYYTIASLRIQLSDNTFANYSNKKSIIEFMIASFLLYLSCFCLIN